MDTDKIEVFRATRSFVTLHKFILEILKEMKLEHDSNIEKVGESLIEMEMFISEKYGIDIDLAHLGKHFEFLTESKFAFLRNKVLDFSNDLIRSLSKK